MKLLFILLNNTVTVFSPIINFLGVLTIVKMCKHFFSSEYTLPSMCRSPWSEYSNEHLFSWAYHCPCWVPLSNKDCVLKLICNLKRDIYLIAIKELPFAAYRNEMSFLNNLGLENRLSYIVLLILDTASPVYTKALKNECTYRPWWIVKK